jgi:hypothetical protein
MKEFNKFYCVNCDSLIWDKYPIMAMTSFESGDTIITQTKLTQFKEAEQ